MQKQLSILCLLVSLVLTGCGKTVTAPDTDWQTLIHASQREEIVQLLIEQERWANLNHDDLKGPQDQSLGLAEALLNQEVLSSEVRLAGFVVPLEWHNQHVTEFLLVPYFGACVHAPPPPANQIVHVRLEEKHAIPFDIIRDAVWAEGLLERFDGDFDEQGEVGYTLSSAKVSAY
ncbi:DUF3299 domain-containing protein [Aliagarivorans marinus]|uniref:DUF3299 domain-containing protein n=1 Tax=Aliagarivorans marinus TaxID=561965 RepID=UPI00042A4C1B|nr:DUF3299 domain-containing protein [Aliagarivorans marinus]